MRRIGIIVFLMLFIVTGVISFESQVYGQSARKALMFLREGEFGDLDLMLKMEVGTMTMLLKKAGFQVDVASSSGQPLAGPHEKIEKVMRLSEIKVDDYMGIIIPCLNIRKGGTGTPEAVAFVKQALANGKPVAAPMTSVSMLAEAGILKGKKYALIWDPLKTTETRKSPNLNFEGAIYSGQGVTLRIPTHSGHPFRSIPAGHSD